MSETPFDEQLKREGPPLRHGQAERVIHWKIQAGHTFTPRGANAPITDWYNIYDQISDLDIVKAALSKLRAAEPDAQYRAVRVTEDAELW